MSAIQRAGDRLRDRIVGRFDLAEVGAPYRELRAVADEAAAGQIRVFTGGPVSKLVDVRMALPSIGVDAVMLHAFTAADVAVPHFTSELLTMGGRSNLVADLMPRVSLVTEPRYLDEVYGPVTAIRDRANALPGAEPVPLPLRLQVFVSPWLIGVSSDRATAQDLESLHAELLDHWFTLIDGGTPPVTERELAERDAMSRRGMFDPATDQVWDFLASLIGQQSIDTVLDLVREPGPPHAP